MKNLREGGEGEDKCLGIQTSRSACAPLQKSAVHVRWWLSETQMLYKTQMLSESERFRLRHVVEVGLCRLCSLDV